MSEDKEFLSRKTYQPGLVFQPDAHRHIGAGINKLVAAIRPTLGPTPRTVAVTRLDDVRKTPEVLDSGGIIARKVIEMGRRDEDMGAMLARALICRQHERMGMAAPRRRSCCRRFTAAASTIWRPAAMRCDCAIILRARWLLLWRAWMT